jgi:hypothetical protein
MSKDIEQKWIDQLKHEHQLYQKHLRALEKEIEELKLEIMQIKGERNQAEFKLAVVVEALNFYSDEETWFEERIIGYPIILDDNGKHARQALKRLEE